MTYAYRVCGLGVLSDIVLPGAVEAGQDGTFDTRVRLAPVCDSLENATEEGPNWLMAPDRFLLRVPKVGRYLIQGGSVIDIELAPEATAHDAAAFVLGTAFGLLLRQRGALALQGAAVAKAGAAIAICGVSAVGKSTLAAALCREGFDFVADDLCVVALGADSRPLLEPDGRQLRLWRESADKLELGSRCAGAVREGLGKYLVEPPAIAPAPPRLTALYALRDSRPPLDDGIEPVAPSDAMRLLDTAAYHAGLRAKLGSKPELMAQSAALLRHVKVFQLARPRGFEHLASTVASLREHADELAR